MKKLPFPTALGCIAVFLICCGCLICGLWDINSRYAVLETQASKLQEDNSKLQEDNSKLQEDNSELNTKLTDTTAELDEKEKYLAGQNDYISELSKQIDTLTNGNAEDDTQDPNENGNGGSYGDFDQNSNGSSQNPYPNLYAEGYAPNADGNGKVVYLTFDDGPSNLTPQVLDLLDRYNAKATFFVVQKNNEDYAEYLSEIVERGHTLALHSYSHDYGLIYSSKNAFLSDYEKVYDWVVENTGYTPSLFRFPGGSNNGSSYIVNDIIDEMEERGFQYFDWNVSSGDGSNLTTTENIIDNICQNVGNVEHPVVLMHDGKGKNATLAALPSVLEYLSNAGYTFHSLDRSVTPVHYR